MGKWCVQRGHTRQRDDSGPVGLRPEISSSYSESRQFKTYEVFLSGLFHLIFSENCRPWLAETTESKILDKGGLYRIVLD